MTRLTRSQSVKFLNERGYPISLTYFDALYGRKRFYNQSAVIKASALNRLTDAGVSIVILRVAANSWTRQNLTD
jgi:hypothetical protein